jgi:Tfp pilus assembly protein FimT
VKARYVPRGFTLIEALVVVCTIGILVLVSLPGILGQAEVRSLENTGREIQSTLQKAKLQAVSTKFNHRVYFYLNDANRWEYVIEREEAVGTWSPMPTSVVREIPGQYAVTVNLPAAGAGNAVEYSPVGMVINFATVANTVLVQSPSLKSKSQPDEVVVTVFMGGSIQFLKRVST